MCAEKRAGSFYSDSNWIYLRNPLNLLPTCGKCKQSKGNKDWRKWMFSAAKLSPKSRGVPNLESRARRLEVYESWEAPTQVAIVGKEKWAQHWSNWKQVQEAMRTDQVLASEINQEVARAKENPHLST